MKDYLEKRRAELKKRGNKGFTLMEMLIVVVHEPAGEQP